MGASGEREQVIDRLREARGRFRMGDTPAGERELDPDERFYEEHAVRTDLALEAHQVIAKGSPAPEIPGVVMEEEDLGFAKLNRVFVETDEGARLMGKGKGRYVTLQVPELQGRDRELERKISRALAGEIEALLSRIGVGEGDTVLCVGLGNWNATPDNVGPLTISKLLVTRHLHQYNVLSEEILSRMRPVAALSPGVLGLTGVETAEIVRGVVERIQPAAVICIDALASMSVDRIGKTFQIADVGINPGSGVGNKRVGLNEETLGVPVLVVGVPTVIYATTIVSDAMERLSAGGAAWPGAPSATAPAAPAMTDGAGPRLDPARIDVRGAGASFAPPTPAARKEFIRQVLGPSMGSLIVTPKEVDVLVESVSDILADSLNEALHPGVSAEEAAMLR